MEKKGSIWRIWDLQVHSILDEGYVPLSQYYEELKAENIEKWNEYTSKVGGENNALLFDSKEYFQDSSVSSSDRYLNYARNLFSFVNTYNPNLGVIGFTDHNYQNDGLIDTLYNYSKKGKCKVICGVEINATGVHMLVFFEKPPYGKETFSEGIKAFLTHIEVNSSNTSNAQAITNDSPSAILDKVSKENGICMFPHCNTANGLFQERGKTDRTYLAKVFNHNKTIFLQSANLESAENVIKFIENKKGDFKSNYIYALGSDSRCLKEIGKPDKNGNYTWIKGDCVFNTLRYLEIENKRIEICNEPRLLARLRNHKTKFIKSLAINKLEPIDDIWFDNFNLELNSSLVAIIGNKGSGKSAITDIIALSGNSHQDPQQYFSFLTTTKFRKSKPINLSEKFEGVLTWADNTQTSKILNENPNSTEPERLKYIPQNFLEKLCSNIDSEEFERELKKIIFAHTPIENRLGKSSLDDLINYRSNFVNDKIIKLENEITKINSEIVLLEEKDSKEYEDTLRNNLLLKDDELTSHLKIKPIEPVSNQTSQQDTSKVNELKNLREELVELENTLASQKTLKIELNLNLEELSQTKLFFDNLKIELDKNKNKDNNYIKTLNKYELNIEDIFTFKIDTNSIIKVIEHVKTQINTINDLLDESKTDSIGNKILEKNKQIKLLQEDLDKPLLDHQKYLDNLKIWEKQHSEIIGNPQLEDSIEYYQHQINYIKTILPLELNEKYNARIKFLEDLYDEKKSLIEIRKDLFAPITIFIEEYKELKDKYDVKIDVNLEIKTFSENFLSFLNLGKAGTFSGKEEGYKNLKELIERANFDTKDGFINFIKEILNALNHDVRTLNPVTMEIKSQLRKGKKLEELYDFIFHAKYLQAIYNLKLGNKPLLELSPGERGALLLIFYLLLDKDDIPLIIDQPEENLDNESVYNILVHFIKQVKEERQIIIVTHNPNLAVVCDADQIVHMKIEKDHKNKVVYSSGSIENSNLNKSVVDILEGTWRAFGNRDAKYIKDEWNE